MLASVCALVKNSSIYNWVRCFSKSYKTAYLCEKAKRKAFNRFRKKYLSFSPESYSTFESLKKANDDYDIFVCGSDQIWNPSFYGGNNKAYFLNFAKREKRKIAYAPSIGLDSIPDEYAQDFSNLVRHLDYISVREANAVEIVKKLSGREAVHVIDPTLLLDGHYWSTLLQDKKTLKQDKPYIFCYLFGTHDEYDEIIAHFKVVTGLDVVMIPFCEKQLKNSYSLKYDAGPLEFLDLIKNAEYVITDSFHATVFSILFARPFYTLPRFKKNQTNSMNSRIYSLLDSLEARDRLLNYDQATSILPDKNIDYTAIYSKLANMRTESLKYLKEALCAE